MKINEIIAYLTNNLDVSQYKVFVLLQLKINTFENDVYNFQYKR